MKIVNAYVLIKICCLAITDIYSMHLFFTAYLKIEISTFILAQEKSF